MKESAPYFFLLRSEAITQAPFLSAYIATSHPSFWILNLSHFLPVGSTEFPLFSQPQKKTQATSQDCFLLDPYSTGKNAEAQTVKC